MHAPRRRLLRRPSGHTAMRERLVDSLGGVPIDVRRRHSQAEVERGVRRGPPGSVLSRLMRPGGSKWLTTLPEVPDAVHQRRRDAPLVARWKFSLQLGRELENVVFRIAEAPRENLRRCRPGPINRLRTAPLTSIAQCMARQILRQVRRAAASFRGRLVSGGRQSSSKRLVRVGFTVRAGSGFPGSTSAFVW